MKSLTDLLFCLLPLALLVSVAACDDSTGADDDDGGTSSTSIDGRWDTDEMFLLIDMPSGESYEQISDTSGTCWDGPFGVRLRSLGGDLYVTDDEDADTLSLRTEGDRLRVADADGSDPETYARSNRSPSDLTPRCDF